MKDIMIDCFLAAFNQLNPTKRDNCFELMGFDFLIDEDFRVWLIEVNTNPYFGVQNVHLPQFIDNLVDDTFRLTLDKIIGREISDCSRVSKYEILFSGTKGINKRRSFNEPIYPVKSIKDKLVRSIHCIHIF